MSADADAIDAEELLREIRALLGKPEPVDAQRGGWTRYPGDKVWDWFAGRRVETVKTTDVL